MFSLLLIVFSICAAVVVAAMESVFGYVSVLPGAFSAYRWKAIRGEPLNAYFFVEENSVREMGPFMANMYLAEDRVLCFELLAKENRTWTLHFVTGAVAETDVPETLLELLKQVSVEHCLRCSDGLLTDVNA